MHGVIDRASTLVIWLDSAVKTNGVTVAKVLFAAACDGIAVEASRTVIFSLLVLLSRFGEFDGFVLLKLLVRFFVLLLLVLLLRLVVLLFGISVMSVLLLLVRRASVMSIFVAALLSVDLKYKLAEHTLAK